MSTPTLTRTFDPNHKPTSIGSAVLRLVASTDGGQSWAYYTGGAVVRKIQGTYDATTGVITYANVRPNTGSSSDVITTPAGTRWSHEVTGIGGNTDTPARELINVQDLAGPLEIGAAGAALDPLPDDIPGPIGAENVTTDVDGLDATTVQAALEELVAIVQGQVPYAQPLGQAVLNPLYTAIAARQANILIIGDSRTFLSRWPDAVDRHLAARWNAPRSPGSTSAIRTGQGWTGTGTEAPVADDGALGATTGSSGFTTTLTSGQSRSRTFLEPVSALTVTYRKISGGGTFAIKQGASTVATVDTSNATTVWSAIATGTGTLGTGAWTIECTSGTVVVEDATPHGETSPTAGVKVWTCAHSGFDLTEWLANSSLRTFWQTLHALGGIDAVVIASSVNEASAAQVTSQLTTMVGYLRTDISTTLPIVIVAPEVLGVTGASAASREKSEAALAASTTLGTGYVNLLQVLGSINADGNAERMSTDNIHGDAAWNQAIADAVTAALSGDPIATLLGLLAKRRDLVRSEFDDVAKRAESVGRHAVGEIEGLGFVSRALWGPGDEAGGASHNPEILEVSADEAAFLTGLGIGITMPGQGWLFSPGGAVLGTHHLAAIPASSRIQTNDDFRARVLQASGRAGAALQVGFPGGTAAVAPTTGDHEVRDVVVATDGSVWVCTVAGTPGTWVRANSVAFQPLDSDLTAIAALSTTSFGRSLLALADAASLRSAAAAVIDDDYGVTITGISTEATLLASTLSISAGLLKAGDVLEVHATVQHNNGSGSNSTSRFRTKFGSTTVGDSLASNNLATGATRDFVIRMRITVETIGASGSLHTCTEVLAGGASSAAFGAGASAIDNSTTTVDTTAAIAIDITGQVSVAGTNSLELIAATLTHHRKT